MVPCRAEVVAFVAFSFMQHSGTGFRCSAILLLRLLSRYVRIRIVRRSILCAFTCVVQSGALLLLIQCLRVCIWAL